MDMHRRSGIVTGILFIVATAAGIPSLFALAPISAPDYLAGIAANEPKVLLGALMVFIMGWAGAGIGISMYPVLRRHNEGLALGAAGFRIIEGVFHCAGGILILLLATWSRVFVSGGAAALAQFDAIGTLLREGRTWVGDVAAVPSWCIAAYLYYALFFRTGLVPRWLSVWGLAGITLTMAGTILVLFGQITSWSNVQKLMYLPAALQEIVLAVWLIVKGYNPSAAALWTRSAS